jgi:hypothetical protein
MKTVNELDYIYRKLVVKSREKRNNTIDISDEEYAKYYEVEQEPVEPIPGGDIPIPGEEDPNHDYSQDYLTFEALEDGTFSFSGYNSLYYSINNGSTWKTLAGGTETELITKGTKVIWKRDNQLSYHWSTDGTPNYCGMFTSTGKFNLSGNILSLFYQSDFNNQNSLPTNVSCYKMFNTCEHLISAKNLVLPSSLTARCFERLFYNCQNLIEVPDLLNSKLVERCYYGMFEQCNSLNKIRMLASDISATDCLTCWVTGVSQSGTFIKNSKTNFNIGTSGIPAGWEVIDEVIPEEGE